MSFSTVDSVFEISNVETHFFAESSVRYYCYVIVNLIDIQVTEIFTPKSVLNGFFNFFCQTDRENLAK